MSEEVHRCSDCCYAFCLLYGVRPGRLSDNSGPCENLDNTNAACLIRGDHLVRCGPFYVDSDPNPYITDQPPALPTAEIERRLLRDCIDDFQRQGYERIPSWLGREEFLERTRQDSSPHENADNR